MRKFIVTFVLEEKVSENIWRTSGNIVSTLEIKNIPVKFSELKSFAEKDLPSQLRIKTLQSICDVTDLVEFDEE